jgi:epoxyqueuosine reductase
MIEGDLKRWADARGVRFAVSGLDVLGIVRAKLEKRRDDGLIDADFFRENLVEIFRQADPDVSRPEAVIVVSAPRPAHSVSMTIGDSPVEVVIPPTYFRYRLFFDEILGELKGVLGRETEVAILKIPLKSLSVHLGLAVYGRNNLTYVPGFGSYHQICGYVVGGEVGRRLRETLGRPAAQAAERSLERCTACRACVKACPTGAVRGDRFLISADKCYTLFSEKSGPILEKKCLPKSACLFGCLECQVVCPENRGRPRLESTGISFTADETGVLLALGERMARGEILSRSILESGTPAGIEPGLWRSIADKFARLKLTEGLDLGLRNLYAFFGSAQ